jgi:hypothetical protein
MLLIEILISELHNDTIELPESGGLAKARDAKARVLIGDLVLCCLLPPQLLTMTEGHKQMNGCEVCLKVIGRQQSLNVWHHCWLQKLKDKVACCKLHDQKLALDARIATYKQNVFENNNIWHKKSQEALKEVQCK